MADRPILTLTLNPALDVSTHVGKVRPDEKLRCAAPAMNPGGGGLNVSRAVARLGGRSRALVALGGATGAQLATLLQAEGLGFVTVQSPGDTRQSLTVTEEDSGRQYRFLLPGPAWHAEDQAQVFAALAAEAQSGGIAVISGSQPPGVPADFPSRLAAAMGGMAVVLDTSGVALAEAVAHAIPSLAVLRMDSDEADTLARRPLTTAKDTADFAAGLVAQGAASVVIIARGAEGNVLVSPTLRLMARPPKVAVISAVGAGDSFVAGLVLAMSRGEGWPEALAFATASAAAAVMTGPTELCRAEDVARLLPQVTVDAL
jgi:6-phosphofructokinase 2